MAPQLKKFIQSWVINTLSVLVAVYLVSGIHYSKPLDLAVASLLLGVLNSIFRPLKILLAIVTLGILTLVTNALLLYFVGFLLKPHFYVDDFSSAFWGALIISIMGIILNALTGNTTIRVQKGGGSNHGTGSGSGGGPVIDV
jgi:putative membrane protein